MRASRLLSILTTLQARGQVTAQALAADCEVSVRTIYRDMDALSAAGIPVYAERGAEGGYRLLDGYRVRLNGLSVREAEALFLTGLSGPAADLGLGAAMAAAQTKLLVALPPEVRAGAERMRTRFHLDAPAWFAEAEQPRHLQEIAAAVWEERRIRLRYRSWKAEKKRVVEPLGLVLKSGTWYLVAQVDGQARTYRVSRILDLAATEQRFTRPLDFDLGAYWQAQTRRLEADIHRYRAVVRLSPWAVEMLAYLTSPFVHAHAAIDETADAEGWRRGVLPVGSLREAEIQLLRFGASVEVLAPPELRARMAEVAGEIGRLYRRRARKASNK